MQGEELANCEGHLHLNQRPQELVVQCGCGLSIKPTTRQHKGRHLQRYIITFNWSRSNKPLNEVNELFSKFRLKASKDHKPKPQAHLWAYLERLLKALTGLRSTCLSPQFGRSNFRISLKGKLGYFWKMKSWVRESWLSTHCPPSFSFAPATSPISFTPKNIMDGMKQLRTTHYWSTIQCFQEGKMENNKRSVSIHRLQRVKGHVQNNERTQWLQWKDLSLTRDEIGTEVQLHQWCAWL